MEEHTQARFIVETLANAGFVAYYAGGWVRDHLLQHPSDDIDIATNAPPETIQALFSHTVPIGIAFGILLVIIKGHQYEVATFRQDLDYHDGRRPSRISFATAEQDAQRRDFTINGMFYDPLREIILDFVNGKEDLHHKIIRAIGNPHERIKEDRLRMIRAIRLACRFNFHIEPLTEKAIRAHAKELFPAVAIERVVQEFQKGLDFKKLRPMLILLHDFALLPSIFPELEGTTLEEIKERTQCLDHFPKEAPLIAHLLTLFPHFSLEAQQNLCKKLKISNTDTQQITFLFRAQQLLAKPPHSVPDYDWAYFYAHPDNSLALHIIAAPLEPAQRTDFYEENQKRINSLAQQINRIEKKDPVVKSADLLEAGIAPGKQMGLLLREAEQIAINRRLENKQIVMETLKQSPHWP